MCDAVSLKMNKTQSELLLLCYLPTLVFFGYCLWTYFNGGSPGYHTAIFFALTASVSSYIAYRLNRQLVRPLEQLTSQLLKDTNATIAAGPAAELSIAIDSYVSHLEDEFKTQLNQSEDENSRLKDVLEIAEAQNKERDLAMQQLQSDVDRELGFIRHIHLLCATPLRGIIGLTNRIAVSPESDELTEELAYFADQLRFLLGETLTSEQRNLKQACEIRLVIDEILELLDPLCNKHDIEIHPFVRDVVPHSVYLVEDLFRSLLFNYILHYLNSRCGRTILRLDVDYTRHEELQISLDFDSYPLTELPCNRFRELLEQDTAEKSLTVPARKHGHAAEFPAQGLTAIIIAEDEIQRESLQTRLHQLGMKITSDFKSPQVDVCFVADENSDTFRTIEQYLHPDVVLFLLNNRTLYNIPNWIQLKHPLNQAQLIRHLQQLDNSRIQEKELINILAVDDSRPNLQLLVLLLEELGHTVTTAENGREAVAMCRSHTFDLVFMDVQMPELDGIEATRQIRRLTGNHARIIGLTAHVSKAEHQTCINAGMENVIVKPVRKNTIRDITRTQKLTFSYADKRQSRRNPV